MKWPDWNLRRTPAGDTLYRRIVDRARSPEWFEAGGVPDTVDGRFDVVALVLSLVLLRLERPDTKDAAARFSVDLTERFIADMDGSLRQMGVGDPTVGKQVGQMVGALGGRLGAYREAFAGGDLGAALERNLYRGAAVDAATLAWTGTRARDLAARLDATSFAALQAGTL